MGDPLVSEVVGWVTGLPPALVYAALGLGAALENVVPAIPADTFVLMGGFLTVFQEGLHARWVFVATWVGNVGVAMFTYRVGHVYGAGFFRDGWGRRVLHPGQMERMRDFYRRWGTWAIFLTRFLPGLRAVVPVFAGVSHQSPGRVFWPLALASGIWYGALVWAGALAGRNLDRVRDLLGEVNSALLIVAGVVSVGLGVWWWRTRRPARDSGEDRAGADDGGGEDGG